MQAGSPRGEEVAAELGGQLDADPAELLRVVLDPGEAGDDVGGSW